MKSKSCTACGAALDEDARFCHRCGAAQASVCASCGAVLDADARFCPQCGAAVAAAGEAAGMPRPAAAGTGPSPPAGAASVPVVQPVRKPYSLLLLLLLAGILAVAAWNFTRGRQAVAPVELAGPPAAPGAAAPVGSSAGAAASQPAAGEPALPPAGAPGAPEQGGGGGDLSERAVRTPSSAGTAGGGEALVVPHLAMGGPEGVGGRMGESGAAAGPISGTVDVAPALQQQVKPGSVIFLIARPAGEGVQRPIAVAKLPLATFPIPFVIGSENLMGGSWGGAVSISARLDQDEDAASKQPGDLYGEAAQNPVQTGSSDVRVVLDRTL